MPGPADGWWDDLRQEAELPAPARPRSRLPVILGVGAAVVASAGLGWWLTSPSEPTFDNPVVTARPPAPPPAAASARADEAQVRRAYEEFGLVYAEGGAQGVARFSQNCEQSLRGDPRILDYCLAFDMFADIVRAPPAETTAQAYARRVELVRATLPGANPHARIDEVQRLMRVATGVADAVPKPAPEEPGAGVARSVPAPQPAVRRRAPEAAGPAQQAPRGETSPRKAPAEARAASTSSCRKPATTADRLLCSNPTLRVQDRRMKAAYEKALALGADPLEIDRGQAEWRAVRNAAKTQSELSALYARRVNELNAAAETARNTPPS